MVKSLVDTKTIGIFDSGIGGKSIEAEIKKLLPKVKRIYLADTKNFPYGEKSPNQIKKIAVENTNYLLGKGADLIVVACNTATVHSIKHLREVFPKVQFVGVEPAVKPAALISKKGIIILSSPKATESKGLLTLIRKYAKNVKVFNIGSLELVEAVENGLGNSEINKILQKHLPKKILDESDVLVLGCTHFPLIKGIIQKYVGNRIKVIDSGEAVARRVEALLNS